MNENDKFLATLVAKLEDLAAQKREIEDKIAGVELTYETFTGVAYRAAATEKKARGPKTGKTLDKDAPEKTLAFLQERVRPVSVDAIAKRFGITKSAASQRGRTLVKLGWAERVSKGKYQTTAKGTRAAETAAPEVATA